MANFKRRHPRRRRKGKFQMVNGSAPAQLYAVPELRRLGGRWRRVTRHDVEWAFDDDRSTDSP